MACATPRCSRRWWPAGWSTYPMWTWSAVGGRCSTSATRCRRLRGAPRTGWRRSTGTRSPRCSSCPMPMLRRCTPAALRAGSPTCPDWPGAARRPSSGSPAPPAAGSLGWRRSPVVSRSPSRRSSSTVAPSPERTRCFSCERPRRPPSATSCWRPPPPRGLRATPRHCPIRGRSRRGTCSCGCSRPAAACWACGRPSTRPVRSSGSCPSGSGSGCCRTRRWCIASPSTGTSWRPASRRPR